MEHYLYVPALGFFLILAILFYYPFKNKFFTLSLRLIIPGLLILYSCLTLKQAECWKQPVAFYERTLRYSPLSWRFRNELGLAYAEAGRNLEAEAEYKDALRINPDAQGVYSNLTNLYKKMRIQQK